MSNKHFLHISDYTGEELWDILKLSKEVKAKFRARENFHSFNNKSLAMIFAKPSARTRVSFEVGIDKLGGNPLTLLKGDIQLGKSESIEDTAAVLSRYLGAITYRCFAHSDVERLANGSSVPVINALSDLHHPCQAAADMMTILENFDDASEVKVAWVGDGNNVLHDLMLACSILGIDFHYAFPKGYDPAADIVARAEDFAKENGSEMVGTNDPKEAVKDANVIYTDVFISMGEEDMKDKLADFDGFQINMELIAGANDKWAFMHCLPAHRGDEVTDAVMDHANSIVFDQAENRMWAQMSLMAYLIDNPAWSAMGEMMGVGF